MGDDRVVADVGETSPPKVWSFQDLFLDSAARLVKGVFRRLGVEKVPALGLLAFPSRDEDAYRPVIERRNGLLWTPSPSKWKDEIIAAEAEQRDSPAIVFFGSSSRGLGFEQVAKKKLDAHDSEAGTRSFLSRAASFWPYEVIVVLEFDRGVYESFPSAVVATEDKKATLEVGLLAAAAAATLDHLFQELSKRWSLQLPTDLRHVDDVLRDAGRHVMQRVQWSTFKLRLGPSLFDRISAISTLLYESSAVHGGIVFGPMPDAEKFELRFKNEIPLREMGWARKILQMASGSCLAYSDSQRIFGIVQRKTPTAEFRVRFRGQNCWNLICEDRVLMATQLGIPSFPAAPLRKESFQATLLRVHPALKRPALSRIWKVVDTILKRRHSATVVVVGDAGSETARLARQGTVLEPTVLSEDAVERAAAIDGAIVLGVDGLCYGIGIILDGAASTDGNPARGSRFNSALRYATGDDGRVVVVFSEDGYVDLFPRLRPALRRSEFDEMLRDVRSHPDGEPFPPELEATCARLFRDYSDYVPDVDWEKVSEGGSQAGLRAFLDDDTSVTRQFDMHPSDFIREEE